MKRIAIYGCGGFGREIMPIAKTQAKPFGGATSDVIFVSDTPSEISTVKNGVAVISFAALISSEHRDRKVIVSLGSSTERRRLVERCEREGLEIGSLTAPTHVSLDDVRVGPGAVFCDFSMCTSNVTIGRNFQCNIYSYVAHDCIIGDFVTFAPRVSCNGTVIIEDDVYVGTGVVLKQGSREKPLRVGKGATIGMGAVVTKDVPPGATVIGNPARPMVKKGACPPLAGGR